MKWKYSGEFEHLKRDVEKTGIGGTWRELPDGTRQFHGDNGGVLNYHPTTGSIWYQGYHTAKCEFEKRLIRAANDRVEPRDNVSSLDPTKGTDQSASEKLKWLSKKISSLAERDDLLAADNRELVVRLEKLERRVKKVARKRVLV